MNSVFIIYILHTKKAVDAPGYTTTKKGLTPEKIMGVVKTCQVKQ
jgi:hypothetical protein